MKKLDFTVRNKKFLYLENTRKNEPFFPKTYSCCVFFAVSMFFLARMVSFFEGLKPFTSAKMNQGKDKIGFKIYWFLKFL